jgi:hypothetical protein
MPVVRPGEPTTIERHWARLIAPLRRLGSSRKPRPRDTASASLAVSAQNGAVVLICRRDPLVLAICSRVGT